MTDLRCGSQGSIDYRAFRIVCVAIAPTFSLSPLYSDLAVWLIPVKYYHSFTGTCQVKGPNSGKVLLCLTKTKVQTGPVLEGSIDF